MILENVIIAAGVRWKGHGRRLVEHVLAWARNEGMSRATLLAGKDNYSSWPSARAWVIKSRRWWYGDCRCRATFPLLNRAPQFAGAYARDAA